MGISIWQLLIVLLIVILVFGHKRLQTLGKDLGTSIKGFRDAMKEKGDDVPDDDNARVIESSAKTVHDTGTTTARQTEKTPR